MEWYNLHRKLAEAIRDPRQKNGELITGSEDGIRYTKAYRDDLLNSALRWIIFNFDPVYLLQNGMPGGILVEEDLGNSAEITTSDNIMRLLAVELKPTWRVDQPAPEGEEEQEVVVQPRPISIPIVTKTSKRINRLYHYHWERTPAAYISDRNKIKLINTYLYPNYDIRVVYIKDFADITEDMDLFITLQLQEYVIEKAFVIEKRNSQKLQESAYLREQLGNDVKTAKMVVEETKQTAYLK